MTHDKKYLLIQNVLYEKINIKIFLGKKNSLIKFNEKKKMKSDL